MCGYLPRSDLITEKVGYHLYVASDRRSQRIYRRHAGLQALLFFYALQCISTDGFPLSLQLSKIMVRLALSSISVFRIPRMSVLFALSPSLLPCSHAFESPSPSHHLQIGVLIRPFPCMSSWLTAYSSMISFSCPRRHVRRHVEIWRWPILILDEGCSTVLLTWCKLADIVTAFAPAGSSGSMLKVPLMTPTSRSGRGVSH